MYPARMRARASVLHVVQLFVLLLAVQLDAFALSSAAGPNQAATLNGRGAAVGPSWRAVHPAMSPESRPKVPLTVQTMSGGGADGQVCVYIGSRTCVIVPGMAGFGWLHSNSVHPAVVRAR